MERGQIELGISSLGKLRLFAQPRDARGREYIFKACRIQAGMVTDFAFKRLAVARWLAEATAVEVVKAFKLAAHTHGPVHRAHIERQRIGDFINRLKCGATFTIHLVDEGDDRNAAQAANFEKLAGLRFNTLCRVDDHDGRIDRSQCPVGIFGEIFMPRRVEQIEDNAVLLKRHHR